MPTTTELTEEYISKHHSIKRCLGEGVINYSALARHIAQELDITKSTSLEAILVAARRFREKLTDEDRDQKVIECFERSNIEVKTNIVVFTLEKRVYPEQLIEIEESLKKENFLFFSIEGTRTINVILQKQHAPLIEKRFKRNIVSRKDDLALITITTEGIGETPGVVHFMTGLLFERGINIEEFMSCHEDTLIIIRSSDLISTMDLLTF